VVTIYLIAYNEEVLLPYTIAYYRRRIPDCKIVLYDNSSTDRTREIAYKHDCAIVRFSAHDRLGEQVYVSIKNHCWKHADTDWVIVADVDEWLDLDPEYLRSTDATIIRTWYVDMVNLKGGMDIEGMDHGVPHRDEEGKWLCFNRRKIVEINYGNGADTAAPEGEVILSDKEFLVRHYRYLSRTYMQRRYKEYYRRLGLHAGVSWWSRLLGHSSRKIKKLFNWHRERAQFVGSGLGDSH
jgi:glycosyltransferase involved in cell wall biosynthesis